MIRPDRLVLAAVVLLLAGVTALTGPVGFGVAAVVVAVLAAAWAIVLVRSADGSS